MLSLKPGARDNWSRGLSEPGRTDFLDELEEIAASGPIR
jgi:hypothetical protein